MLRKIILSVIAFFILIFLMTSCDSGEFNNYGNLQGQVTSEGELLSEVKIELEDKTAQSCEEGYWEFENIPEGEYKITAEKEGYYKYTEPIFIEEGANTYNISMTIIKYELDIDVDQGGEVEVTEIIKELSSEEYPHKTKLEVTAFPDEGWYFDKWGGYLSGDKKTETIIMDSDKTLEPVFKEYATAAGNISVEHNFPNSAVDDYEYNFDDSSDIEHQTNNDASDLEYKDDELIVSFFASVSEEEREEIIHDLSYEILDEIPILDAYLVEVPKKEVEESKIKAQSRPNIKYAEPNKLVEQAYTEHPNDEYYYLQWHYPMVRLPQVWNDNTGSSNVRIAVVDSGVDIYHPDIGGNVDSRNGYNFVDNNSDFIDTDDDRHGTHVAGTIGADTNNHTGVSGVMWDVDILPVKVMEGGGGDVWDICQGILYSASLLEDPENPWPADVINLSLGGAESDLQEDTVKMVDENTSTIMVGATGNNNGSILYPAAYPEVIAVGAVDYNYPYAPERADYSNYGPEIDVVAPGGDTDVDTAGNGFADGVLSLGFNENELVYNYPFYEGTSMAAPHVSGIIGLMLAEGIAHSDVKEILRETSMDLGSEGHNHEYGYGLVNSYWAVNEVSEMNIAVGRLNGDEIEIEEETVISSLSGGEFLIENITEGEYRIFGFVDVQNTGQIEPGDYFAMSEELYFEEGSSYDNIEGFISEVKEGTVEIQDLGYEINIKR